MACPTCDHTMQALAMRLWWCPRCGTLLDGESVERPALVGRVREFYDNPDNWFDTELWSRLGIEEATRLPGERDK